jgi:hypothetical protein
MRVIPYASAIGSNMYAMLCTCPDVSYALSAMSRYQANYNDAHWTIVKNILKYLRRTMEVFLVFGGEEELVVKGYNDASFQTDTNDSKSQSDFVFCLNGGAVILNHNPALIKIVMIFGDTKRKQKWTAG